MDERLERKRERSKLPARRPVLRAHVALTGPADHAR